MLIHPVIDTVAVVPTVLVIFRPVSNRVCHVMEVAVAESDIEIL